jgi:hypothetical protein
MANCNYKVVAELRPDLTETERNSVMKRIQDLQTRLAIVNLDNVTYCKAQPIKGHDDFGAVTFFYSALKDIKGCFSRLEYYDLWGDRKRVAV